MSGVSLAWCSPSRYSDRRNWLACTLTDGLHALFAPELAHVARRSGVEGRREGIGHADRGDAEQRPRRAPRRQGGVRGPDAESPSRHALRP